LVIEALDGAGFRFWWVRFDSCDLRMSFVFFCG
jgi:hypothetical protein